MALVTFANDASTTIAADGYNDGASTAGAPASGTTETWTLSSASGLPSADSSATPPTQFHWVDPAAPTELIAVTDLSGTTASVTRGAESTTPVTHAAGATFYATVTAGDFETFLAAANNLSDLESATTARTNLGLGTAATANINTSAGNILELGTNSAGSTGEVADAGHVHPTTGLVTTADFPLSIADGGTGETSASAALSALGGAPIASPSFTGTVEVEDGFIDPDTGLTTWVPTTTYLSSTTSISSTASELLTQNLISGHVYTLEFEAHVASTDTGVSDNTLAIGFGGLSSLSLGDSTRVLTNIAQGEAFNFHLIGTPGLYSLDMGSGGTNTFIRLTATVGTTTNTTVSINVSSTAGTNEIYVGAYLRVQRIA